MKVMKGGALKVSAEVQRPTFNLEVPLSYFILSVKNILILCENS